MLGTILIILAGAVMGSVITLLVCYEKPVGDLRIDCSDPDDGPYMFLELEQGTDVIGSRKRVTLNVNTKNYISQK